MQGNSQWLNVRNEGDGVTADIYLFDAIDNWYGIGKNSFIQAIEATGATQLNVHISSPGGDVDAALAMHDYLKSYNGKVKTILTGVVASAATIVASGGQVVEMSDNALYMIHNCWTVAVGDADQLRQTADVADKFNERIVRIYTKKTGKRPEPIRTLMDAETWMDAKEAKAHGFVDKIIEPVKLAASIDLSKMKAMGFKNIPADKLEKINSHIENMENKTILERLEKGFSDLTNAIANIGKPKAAKEGEPAEPAVTEIKVLDNAEVTAKLAEVQASIQEVSEANTVLQNSVTAKDTEIATLKAENARLKAGGVDQVPGPDADGDPNAKADPWKQAAKELHAFAHQRK